jgi:hypothetical protein
MRKLALAVCLMFACAPFAVAQEKKGRQEGADRGAEKAAGAHEELQRPGGCEEDGGDARKKFMSSCLKGASAKDEKMSPSAGAHEGLQQAGVRQADEGRRPQEVHERLPEGLGTLGEKRER